jgi:DNA-binding NarL/FixJ family response regulator
MPQTKKAWGKPTGQLRVIVIDNNEMFLNTLVRYISHYEDLKVVGTAANAEDGLRLARELRPDIVLVDLRMPNVSGFTLISWLRQQVPGVCIVAMSLYLEQNLMRAALERGANAFLPKDQIVSGLPPLLEQLAESGCFGSSTTKTT